MENQEKQPTEDVLGAARGWLEGVELRLEKSRRHEMTCPFFHPIEDEFLVSTKVHPLHVREAFLAVVLRLGDQHRHLGGADVDRYQVGIRFGHVVYLSSPCGASVGTATILPLNLRSIAAAGMSRCRTSGR